jgi:hypothetical protein
MRLLGLFIIWSIPTGFIYGGDATLLPIDHMHTGNAGEKIYKLFRISYRAMASGK